MIKIRRDNFYRFNLALAAVLLAASQPLALAQEAQPTVEDLKACVEKAEANPSDPKLRFEYAETLRKMGKTKQASKQYMAVTDIDASYYVAYHMIALHSKDEKILAEATRRLEHLKDAKPKELMLRVALSELLEAQGQYYKASRALVDLVFLNAIPDKYRKKVNTRIVYLQAKARDSNADKHSVNPHQEPQKNSVDPPLPEETIKRGLAASKVIPDGKSDNIGNVPVER